MNAINNEQLQLLQLCFGEHEFCASGSLLFPSSDAATGDISAQGVNDGAQTEASETPMDYDPFQFIDEKLQHGIELETVCKDLMSFEKYLQAKIMTHVHEDVYEAFVNVSGQLVGLDEQLTRIHHPLTASRNRIESALDHLSAKENSIHQLLQDAEGKELHRMLHMGIAQTLLLHNTLCDDVDALQGLPFFASLQLPVKGTSASSSTNVSSAAAATSLSVPPPIEGDLTNAAVVISDEELRQLESVVACYFDLESAFAQLSIPSQGNDELNSEYRELKELVKEAHEHIVHLLNQAFLQTHELFLFTTTARSGGAVGLKGGSRLVGKHVPAAGDVLSKLRVLMSLYNQVGVDDFTSLYRESIVRKIAEDVLSWKSSAQARSSSDQSSQLLSQLCATLLTTVLPIASIMREVFAQEAAFYPISAVFWPPVCNTVVTRMVYLFVPGIPSTFHSNFVAAHQLISLMENHCTTIAELQGFRTATETTLWCHKWNIDVYHTLRATEASERVKQLLLQPETLSTKPPSPSLIPFSSAAAQTISEVMLWYFDSSIFLFPLSQKLLRDSLSALHEFVKFAAGCVKDSLAAFQQQSRVVDYHFLCSVVADFTALQQFMESSFKDAVEARTGESVASCPPLASIFTVGQEIIKKKGIETVRKLVIDYLLEQCMAILVNVKTIKATYSHTKKPMPSMPSWFISGVFESLSKFKAQCSGHLPSEVIQFIVKAVVDEATLKLKEFTKETIVSARKTEESLGKLRRRREEANAKSTTTASTGGSGGTETASTPTAPAAAGSTRVTSESATDRDKMVVQLYLDAHEFGSQLRPFGINKESYTALHAVLKLCRRANWLLGDDIPEPPEVDDDE